MCKIKIEGFQYVMRNKMKLKTLKGEIFIDNELTRNELEIQHKLREKERKNYKDWF